MLKVDALALQEMSGRVNFKDNFNSSYHHKPNISITHGIFYIVFLNSSFSQNQTSWPLLPESQLYIGFVTWPPLCGRMTKPIYMHASIIHAVMNHVYMHI